MNKTNFTITPSLENNFNMTHLIEDIIKINEAFKCDEHENLNIVFLIVIVILCILLNVPNLYNGYVAVRNKIRTSPNEPDRTTA